MLNAKKIKLQIKTDVDVLTFDSVDSTNLMAKNLANTLKKDTLIIANHQTAGRGRMGRNFVSPKNSGVYLSLLLHPKIKFEDFTLITTAAAVSIANAIDLFSEESTKIKWVNDIFLHGKKVCGILTEGVFENDNAYAVLGVGINLYEPKNGFANEIKDIAGGIFNCECSDEIKIKLIAQIVNNFYTFYKHLPQRKFLECYRKKDLLIDKEISCVKNGTPFHATAKGITDDFELVVVDQLNNVTFLSSGEVTIGSEKS